MFRRLISLYHKAAGLGESEDKGAGTDTADEWSEASSSEDEQ